jgi:hypothetical protein
VRDNRELTNGKLDWVPRVVFMKGTGELSFSSLSGGASGSVSVV